MEESAAALQYSHKLIAQKLSNDLAVERELKEKMRQYDSLAKDLIDISKKSTHSVMVGL